MTTQNVSAGLWAAACRASGPRSLARRALLTISMLLAPAPVLAQPQGAAVVVDEAAIQTVEQWREVTGNLRAVHRTLLAAEEEGLVVEINKLAGDRVEAGEVVARLDDARAQLDVRRARAIAAARRAAVSVRRSEAERAARDLARLESAQARASATETELDERRTAAATAEASLQQAEAELSQAEAELALAEQRLADMQIVAPFAGRIVERRTEVGQWLQAGDPVVGIVEMDTIEAWLDVPERLIDAISSADADVQVRIGALGETIAAPVTAIVPDADPLSRLFPVRVRLENKDGRLRPGMSAVGLVPTGAPAPTLTIPKDALLRDDAGEFVYFNAGGVAAVARVQSMFAVGQQRLAIQPGSLQPGAQVVVEGNERLFPGSPITVIRNLARPDAAPAGGGAAPSDPPAPEKGR